MSASDRIQDASVVCSGLYLDGRCVPVRQLSISSADSVGKVLLAEMVENGFLQEALKSYILPCGAPGDSCATYGEMRHVMS